MNCKQNERTKRYNEYIKNLPEIPKTVTDYISKLRIYITDNDISNIVHIIDSSKYKYTRLNTLKSNGMGIGHLTNKYLLEVSGKHNARKVTIMYQTTKDGPFVYYVTIIPKLTTNEKISNALIKLKGTNNVFQDI